MLPLGEHGFRYGQEPIQPYGLTSAFANTSFGAVSAMPLLLLAGYMTWGCFFLLSCGFGMLIDNLNSDEAMSDSGGIHGRALSIPLPSLALLHELATRAELMGLPQQSP